MCVVTTLQHGEALKFAGEANYIFPIFCLAKLIPLFMVRGDDDVDAKGETEI